MAPADAPWPTHRGGPARTGAATGSGPETEPAEHWTVDLGFLEVESAPVVADGTVYVGSPDDAVHAFDLETGTEEWRFETGDWVRTAPTVAGDALLVTVDEYCYALDRESGTERWRYDCGRIHTSPAVVDGVAYLGSDDERLHAIDVDSGEARWTVGTDGLVRSSPAVVDGTVYVGANDSTLYAVDAETGEERWTCDADALSKIEAAPAVADGRVYVASGNQVHAVDAAAGTVEWSFEPSPAMRTTAPAVDDGTVVFGCGNTGVYGIDAASGEKQWVFAADDGIAVAPAIASGRAYVAAGDATLYAVDVDAGEAEWEYDLAGGGTGAPAILEGTAVVGDGDGTVHAIRGESDASAAAAFGEAGGDVTVPPVPHRSAPEAGWVAPGGGPNRAGYGGGAGPASPVRERFSLDAGREAPAAAIADGRVYLGGSTVRALALDDGAETWTFDPDASVEEPPVVADGRAYVVDREGVLYGVDAEDGTEVWRLEDPHGATAAPAVAGDLLYVPVGGEVRAIDAETGERRWAADCPTGVAPVVGHGMAFVASGDELVALDAGLGSERWRADLRADAVGRPALAGETLYVACEDGVLRALDADGGDGSEISFRYRADADLPAGPAIATGPTVGTDSAVETDSAAAAAVVVQPASDRLVGIDRADGEELFATTLRAPARTVPAVAEGVAYVACEDGTVEAVVVDGDAHDGLEAGDRAWFHELQGPIDAPVSVGDGAAVVVERPGGVTGLEERPGSESTADLAAGWSALGGDARRTGALGPGPERAEGGWTADLDEPLATAPAVDEGSVYVGRGAELVGLTAASGEPTFEAALDASVSAGAAVGPAPDDAGTPAWVYVGTEGGRLYAVDPERVTAGWVFEPDNGGFASFRSVPAVADGRVVAGCTDGYVYAVDAADGSTAWAVEVGARVESDPVVADGTVFVGAEDGRLLAIDLGTGALEWTAEVGGGADGVQAGPAVADGTVYALGAGGADGAGGGLVAIDADDGTLTWELEGLSGSAAPAVGSELVYAGSTDGVCYAVDPAGGTVQWRHDVDGPIEGSPVVADETVYVAGDEQVAALDAATGDELWTLAAGGAIEAAPAVANGALLVPDGSGTLRAVGGEAADQTGAGEAGASAREAGEGEADDAGDAVDAAAGEAPMVPLQRDLAPDVDAPAGAGGASSAEPAFAATAATDDESPASDDVRAAVLGVLLDRWTQGHRSATVSFDGLVDGVAAQVPHASVELVRHAVQRLAEDRYLLYEPGSGTVKLRARGVEGYEELTGRSPMPGEVLRAVLEALYEQARHSPSQPRLSREELLEEADVAADALDRMVWYLSDIGKRVGDVYVDDWAGYVDLVTHGDGNPWWTSAALNDDGKRLYENLD